MSSSARRSERASISQQTNQHMGEIIYSHAQYSHSADTSEAKISRTHSLNTSKSGKMKVQKE